MIKNILFVSLLLAGGTLWASAQSQTTEGAAASLPASKKENMTISQLFQKVEDNSKTLRTSLSGIEAAHLGIEAAKSKKLPDLEASLSFSYIGNALITDRDFSNVHGLKSPHFGNNFAFQAQQVVYAGGAINAGIKLAELGKQQAEVGVKYSLSSLFKSNKRIKQAAVETRQTKEAHAVQAEQLNNNVQAAYVQYQQTYVELETQRKSVELAQQNYDVMNARYLSQLALVTDMVDASNLKLNAELSEVDARINIVYAYYRMKYVAGEI